MKIAGKIFATFIFLSPNISIPKASNIAPPTFVKPSIISCVIKSAVCIAIKVIPA